MEKYQDLKDSIFISGLNSSTVEADLISLFKPDIHGDFTIILHPLSFLDRSFLLGELRLPISECSSIYQKFANFKFSSQKLKLIPKNSMKNLVISNLPLISSEKDLFLILLRLTPGLKRIIVPENPENPGRTYGIILANYLSHEYAAHGLEALKKTNNIFQKKVSACWKEPFTDVLGELSLETPTIYIKNLSFNVTMEEIKVLLEEYGKIKRICKYVNKAFVEFEMVSSAKKALEGLNEKRVKGTFWRIYPGKRFDSERYRERNYKNLTFSKNFLDDFDQQKLLKLAYDGDVDETHLNYQMKAKNILDNAKAVLGLQIEALKKQYNNMKKENFDDNLSNSPEIRKKVHIESYQNENKIIDEGKSAANDWHHNILEKLKAEEIKEEGLMKMEMKNELN